MPSPQTPVPQIFFGRNILVEALNVEAPISKIFVDTEAAKKFAESLQRVKARKIPLVDGIPSYAKNQGHQGIVFETTHAFYENYSPEIFKKFPFIIFCNHVEDVHNFGSIARCAAAFGAGLIVHEENASASLTASAVKSSAGLAFRLRWMAVKNITTPLSALRAQGFHIVGLDAQKNSVGLFEWIPQFPLALILGSEGFGIAKEVKAQCEALIKIPMEKFADSLNVSHAAAIAMNWAFRAGKPS